jgi:hypothetical protein
MQYLLLHFEIGENKQKQIAYNWRKFDGSESFEIARGETAPAMNLCPMCRIESFSATTRFLSLSDRWMPDCSKSNKKSCATCWSTEDMGNLSPASTTAWSAQ